MAIDQDSSDQSASESRVWSDLRAIRFISQLQMEVQSLKVANSRLRMFLALSVIALGSALVTLTYFQLRLYEKLEQHLSPSHTKTNELNYPITKL